MRTQKGFTLLEVLIVVVIAVSVAAFAVPAYKKSQDRNRYMAAQGALIDLGNGVRALRADLAVDAPNKAFPTSGYLAVSASWQGTSGTNYTNSKDKPLSELNNTTLGYALFSRRYMSPIAFDSGNSFKGYLFYICPQNTATSSVCCQSNSNAVACMSDSSYASRPTKGQYYGALYTLDGNVTRLTK